MVQTKVSSMMDFLEKPQKLSDTDKAQKVTRWQYGVPTRGVGNHGTIALTGGCPCRSVSTPMCSHMCELCAQQYFV